MNKIDTSTIGDSKVLEIAIAVNALIDTVAPEKAAPAVENVAAPSDVTPPATE